MTPNRYDRLIRAGRAGIYAAPRLLGPLRAAARRAGIAWIDLDLVDARNRAEFLRRCGEVFDLPDYYGENWDALHECLLDAASAGTAGAVVHWRRGGELARRAPEVVDTAIEIFREVALRWGSGGRVFLVVADAGSAPGRGLQPLRGEGER